MDKYKADGYRDCMFSRQLVAMRLAVEDFKARHIHVLRNCMRDMRDFAELIIAHNGARVDQRTRKAYIRQKRKQ